MRKDKILALTNAILGYEVLPEDVSSEIINLEDALCWLLKLGHNVQGSTNTSRKWKTDEGIKFIIKYGKLFIRKDGIRENTSWILQCSLNEQEDFLINTLYDLMNR